MDKKSNTRVITIKDLFGLFIHYLWLMALAAILVVGGAFIFKSITYTPRYESVAKLYILRQDNESSSNNNTSYDDFNLALKVVKDCENLIKGHSTLDAVITELQLDMSYGELFGSVEVSNPSDTRILNIRVESDSPENAKIMVDKICEIGTQEIEEAMGFKQVNFYEPGVLNESPCNTTSASFYIILGFVAAVAVYAIFFLAYLLDDRIQSIDEFEQLFGITTLGEVPNMDADANKKRYGYYKNRYSLRGYYKRSYYRRSSTYGDTHTTSREDKKA